MFASEHNRRRFLSLLSAAALPLVLRRAGGSLSYIVDDKTLRIGIIGRDDGNVTAEEQNLLNGVQLGVDEATQTASMFGYSVHAEQISEQQLAKMSSSAKAAVLGAVVGGVSVEACLRIRDAATRIGALYLNAGCSADGLRREHCHRLMFHVGSSDAMRADAERHDPGYAIAGVPGTKSPWGPPVIRDWHESLERFGAGQLTDRYRARFPRGEMDGMSWSGWMSVKVLGEAMLRTGKTDAISLAAFLESDRARFDGHKGVPLSFRTWDHQLRQPLYGVRQPLVPNAELRISEIPDSGIARLLPGQRDGLDVNAMLDQLGDTAQSTSCHWPS